MPNNPVPAAATGLPDTHHRSHDPRFWMLLAYSEWLFMERRLLCHELGIDERFIPRTEANLFHFPHGKDWQDIAQPSGRAIGIMSFAGVRIDQVRQWAEQEVKAWEGAR